MSYKPSYGITLAKPTGKVLEEDNQYIQVALPDSDKEGTYQPLLVYARPCYQFGSISAPSEEFLEKYKDEILICLIFEKGCPEVPLWVGYTFADGKGTDIPANFPRTKVFRTEKFFVSIDDAAEEAVITHRPDSEFQQSVKIDKDFLTLGQYSADKELALIGETTRDFLKDFITAVKNMKFSTTNGSTVNLLTLPDFVALESRIDEILSKSVKLD